MLLLTTDEVRALAEKIDPHYRVLIYVAAYTGLRSGELLALRRQTSICCAACCTSGARSNTVRISARSSTVAFSRVKAETRWVDLPVVHSAVAFAMLAVGAPLCLVRLWWMWWQSVCGGCGLQHSACTCGPGDHIMRPPR